ncbi:MAG: CBS domain-containing protein [Proteobacteria bacterium]|nr:CBS domain-containing protein [Pseudomonadota bacterium]
MQHSQPRVRVSAVMTRKVETATPEQPLGEVLQLLAERNFHHLPIVEEGKPVGMISSRDLVRIAHERGARELGEGLRHGETAADVMSTELETIGVDEPVEAAINRIGLGDIHSLVVLDDADRLAGIVTNRDLIRYLTS